MYCLARRSVPSPLSLSLSLSLSHPLLSYPILCYPNLSYPILSDAYYLQHSSICWIEIRDICSCAHGGCKTLTHRTCIYLDESRQHPRNTPLFLHTHNSTTPSCATVRTSSAQELWNNQCVNRCPSGTTRNTNTGTCGEHRIARRSARYLFGCGGTWII